MVITSDNLYGGARTPPGCPRSPSHLSLAPRHQAPDPDCSPCLVAGPAATAQPWVPRLISGVALRQSQPRLAASGPAEVQLSKPGNHSENICSPKRPANQCLCACSEGLLVERVIMVRQNPQGSLPAVWRSSSVGVGAVILNMLAMPCENGATMRLLRLGNYSCKSL